MEFTANYDLGFKEAWNKWNGRWLDETAYDQVISSIGVKEDIIKVYKPFGSIDEKPLLAVVVKGVYTGEVYNEVKDSLFSIDDLTTMRANASGPIDHEEMKKKGLIEGKDYKLRTPNSYYVRTKSGGWGMIAYAAEIHSVMIGYKRGRFTGAIDVSGWTKDNPEKFEILKEIAVYNEKAFDKANSIVYNKQRKFAEEYIQSEHRIGIFTTLSANRYHAGQSAKMSAHIDSGDTEFGMTSMCVFRQGDYQGAYLLFPRYGIGIDAPDNSVLIADSREVHGVTSIRGNGERFSCVAYCDNRLATIGNAGKSERLIGKYAKKHSGNLEEFI